MWRERSPALEAVMVMGPEERRRWCTALAVALCLGCTSITGTAFAEQTIVPNAIASGTTSPASTTAAIPAAHKSLGQIPVWKRITLGTYRGVDAVREAFDAQRLGIGDSANEILGRPAFRFSRTRTDLDLVVVTIADLGFAGGATLAEIHRQALQVGLHLCPAEVGPILRLAYLDQRVGEFLHIAMEPVATYRGDLVDLTIANGGAGLLMVGGDGNPGLKVAPSSKFIFVHPSRVAVE